MLELSLYMYCTKGINAWHMPNIAELNELSVPHLMHIPVNHKNCEASDDKNENVAKRRKAISYNCLSTFLENYPLNGGNLAERVLDMLQVKIKFRLTLFDLPQNINNDKTRQLHKSK